MFRIGVRRQVVARALRLEEGLRRRLVRLQERHALVGDVRGLGLFFALELVADRTTREPLVPWQGPGLGVMSTLFAALRRRGCYAFGRYNVLHVAPPLVIEERELDEAAAILDAALGELEAAPARGAV